MLTRTRWTGVAAVVALSAGLAACSGGPGNSTTGDLTWEDSPLDRFYRETYAAVELDSEEAQAENAERQRRQEELVAQCMTEQGFDYTPVDYSDSYVDYPSGQDGPGEGPEWGSSEYAEQFGYDIFTRYGAGEEPALPGDGPGEWTDPNAWVYEELSESELRAWEEALWGAPMMEEMDPDAEWEEGEWEWDWQSAGCQGWAQHELEEEDPWVAISQVLQDPTHAELLADMDGIYATISTDPRFAELDRAWSACLAEAGYRFADPAQAQESIYQLDAAFWEENADNPDYLGPSQDEIAAARTEEIALATADFTCQEDVNYSQERLRIQFEIEQDFLDANADRLEQFAAAIAAAAPARTP